MKPSDFDTVVIAFEQIKNTRIRFHKQEILNQLAATSGVNNLTREILTYLLNPYWTYGIRLDNKPYTPTHWPLTTLDEDSAKYWPAFRELLDLLKARLLTGNRRREIVQAILGSMSTRYSWFLCNLLNRDLKCGVTTGMFRKAFPNLAATVMTFTIVGYKRGSKDKPHQYHCGAIQIKGKFRSFKILSWMSDGMTDEQRDEITKRFDEKSLVGSKIDVEFSGTAIVGPARADGTHSISHGVFKSWRADLQ